MSGDFISITVNKRQFDHLIRNIPPVIRTVAENTAKEVLERAKDYYTDLVNEALEHGHYEEDSIKKLTTESEVSTTGASQFFLKQASRAGYMMEVSKKSPGGFKTASGKHVIFKGMNPRVDKYLEAIGKDSIVVDANKITGVSPLKPMERTFTEFVVPEYQKKIKTEMVEGIKKHLSQGMPQL